MNDIEPVTGPSETRKTVMVMLDPIETAILKDALDAYADSHEGPIADVCAKTSAALRWALA